MADDEKDDPEDEDEDDPEDEDEREPEDEDEREPEDEDEHEPEDEDEHEPEGEDEDEHEPEGENEPEDEHERHDDTVARLKARVAELESTLASQGVGFSPAARWAGWVLGALVGATSLALIVIVLGGGLTGPCDCPEASDEGGGGPTPEQQAQLERLLRQHTGDFQACFNEWSTAHSAEVRPGWAVMVRLEIQAGAEGAVVAADASGEGLPEALGECLERRVRRWTFPAEGPYTLEIPFAVDGAPPDEDLGSDPGGDRRRRADAGPASDASND